MASSKKCPQCRRWVVGNTCSSCRIPLFKAPVPVNASRIETGASSPSPTDASYWHTKMNTGSFNKGGRPDPVPIYSSLPPLDASTQESNEASSPVRTTAVKQPVPHQHHQKLPARPTVANRSAPVRPKVQKSPQRSPVVRRPVNAERTKETTTQVPPESPSPFRRKMGSLPPPIASTATVVTTNDASEDSPVTRPMYVDHTDAVLNDISPLIDRALQRLFHETSAVWERRHREVSDQLKECELLLTEVLKSNESLSASHKEQLQKLAEMAASRIIREEKRVEVWKKRAVNEKHHADLLKCCVCLDQPRQICVQPCSHLVLCERCCDRVREIGKCPMCNTPASDFVPVYLP